MTLMTNNIINFFAQPAVSSPLAIYIPPYQSVPHFPSPGPLTAPAMMSYPRHFPRHYPPISPQHPHPYHHQYHQHHYPPQSTNMFQIRNGFSTMTLPSDQYAGKLF